MCSARKNFTSNDPGRCDSDVQESQWSLIRIPRTGTYRKAPGLVNGMFFCRQVLMAEKHGRGLCFFDELIEVTGIVS